MPDDPGSKILIQALPKGVREGVQGSRQLGSDLLVRAAGKDGSVITVLVKASGQTIKEVEKAGSNTVTTVNKAAKDMVATYEKAWKDSAEQAKRSMQDAADAGAAAVQYTSDEFQAQLNSAAHASDRLREGKVIDVMWGISVEPLQQREQNFAKATQKSSVINGAAQTAATVYGGPGGAAAYAAWSTYRATGDADFALRAGVMAAITSQTGSSISSLPSTTAQEIVKKAALAGAAGGIAVAAAGGDEQAITDAFLKSGGQVIVQSGSAKLKAYSPKAHDAMATVQCISSRDVSCMSNLGYVKNLKGKILYDEKGQPRFKTINTDKYLPAFTRIDPKSAEGVKQEFMTRISKLPGKEIIPLLNNKMVLTWNFSKANGKNKSQPYVVLTAVGSKPPFEFDASYRTNKVRTSKPATPGSKSATLTYTCPVKMDRRKVISTSKKGSCHAVYKRGNGPDQDIWKSDQESQICATKARAFVKHLKSLGIRCSQG